MSEFQVVIEVNQDFDQRYIHSWTQFIVPVEKTIQAEVRVSSALSHNHTWVPLSDLNPCKICRVGSGRRSNFRAGAGLAVRNARSSTQRGNQTRQPSFNISKPADVVASPTFLSSMIA